MHKIFLNVYVYKLNWRRLPIVNDYNYKSYSFQG